MNIEDFKRLYPGLSQSFVDEQISLNMRLANVLINNRAVGEVTDDILGLMTAHLLTLDKQAGSSGAGVLKKTSKRIGDVAFTYSQETGDRGWYNLTSYGQKLLVLLDSYPTSSGAFVV